ncbi:hypothetical protein MSG28_001142 [Choristoneura fumiferana]|uniref:Uncharacterized protein n=1 Tax=Choristoneura fumiferana TaxID=7141 RepID=A0ACC0K3X0_CHOFU|nr:hypothetical protein MSG28_001142 [Choristoneura fumiferana]
MIFLAKIKKTDVQETSPKVSDTEETEEIVTKFIQAPSGEPIQIKTKRTTLRKKKKTEKDTVENDVVIEEKLDDDDVIKPQPVQQHDVDIEEFEETDFTTVKDTARGTVELPDDYMQVPKMESQVQIEEIEDEHPGQPEEVNEETKTTRKVKVTKRITKMKQGAVEEVHEATIDKVDEEPKPVELTELPEEITENTGARLPSPITTDTEETEEIVTKFKQGPSGEPIQVKTKRTILRKKKKTDTNESVENDVVIEEKIDDDDVLKPQPIQHHDVDIEEFEETDIVSVKDTAKGTVQLPEDNLQETKLESQVKIEEIIEEYPTESEIPSEIKEEEDTTTSRLKSKKIITKKKQKSLEETVEIKKLEPEPTTTIELPEETTIEEEITPEGKASRQKTTTKRIIKRRKGSNVETTQITTEQIGDDLPIISVHTTEQFIEDTIIPFEDTIPQDNAKVVEEAPEKVEITQVQTKTGEIKKIKTTKRIIKRGPKELTEITTVEKDGEEPFTTVSVIENEATEEQPKLVEAIELPEEVTVEEEKSPEGKPIKKTKVKRIIKRRKGSNIETTNITTEQVDDNTPIVSVHTTEEITNDTITPFEDILQLKTAKVVEEVPEKVEITQVRTATGEVKKVKTTKRVIKRGPKEQVTEITTIEKEGEVPITTVSLVEEKGLEEEKPKPIETVELPEQITVEEEKTPDGKITKKTVTKRIIKRRKGSNIETTQITTEQTGDNAPITSIHTREELVDDTITPFEDTPQADTAKVIEETPEKVEVTQVRTETGEVKKIKTTKRVIKRGPKEKVTEITTIEKDGEEPITTVSVIEDQVAEEEKVKFDETVELPEEITVEEEKTPEGKITKKTTKRIIKRKKGPQIQTTHITTEQVDDEEPVISVHTTQELTDDTVTSFEDTIQADEAKVVEEVPEKVEISQVLTATGEVKKVKTTKRVIKRGPKEQLTEITTIEKEGEKPFTTVSLVEEKGPKEEKSKPIETIELPEETTVEEEKTPEGKITKKTVTKRIIKRRKGSNIETTQITTEQIGDDAPITSVHTTEELTDDTITPFEGTPHADTAKIIEYTPEKVEVTQVRTETGEIKKIKTSKRVIKRGPEDKVTEITTIEKDDEEPIITVSVIEDKAAEDEKPKLDESVELPEEITVEQEKTAEGKIIKKTTTKRIIKRKKGPQTETTHITTEQIDDNAPVISVHTTQELTDDSATLFDDSQMPDTAKVLEHAPEKVEITKVHTKTGEVKKIKTIRRLIKQGSKEKVTEITTIEKDGEEPITTVSLKNKEKIEEEKPMSEQTIELPEEITVEEGKTPEERSTNGNNTNHN